jgi:SAM-dependent methyltransferase
MSAGQASPSQPPLSLLQSIKSAVKADRITIFQLGPESLLWTRYADGVERPIFPFWTEVGLGVSGVAASRREPVISHRAGDDPASISTIRDTITGYTTDQLLACPVLDPQGDLLGVIECINRRTGRFEMSDAEALEPFMEELRDFLRKPDPEWARLVDESLAQARRFLSCRSEVDWEHGDITSPDEGASYDKKFSGFRDYSREARFLRDVLASFRPGARTVLDLACGTGTHALELASLGLSVTGLDLDPKQLSEARRKSAELGVDLELIQGDMTDYSTAAKFDVVFNFFYGLQNVLLTRPQQEECLKCAWRSLKDDGILVLDFLNEEVNLKEFPPGVERLVNDGSQTGVRIASCSYLLDERLKLLRMTFARVDGESEPKSEVYYLYRMYPETVEDLLGACAFKATGVFGDFDVNSRFDRSTSPRMIYVAEKAGHTAER